VLTTQALLEFYSVAIRKVDIPPDTAMGLVRRWMSIFPGVDANRAVLERAMLMSLDGRFSHWDAMLLATAEEAGCRACLSEDMQDGAAFAPLAIRNPFAGAELSVAAKQVLGA
jgi:predicted nucleic acid-binding protein